MTARPDVLVVGGGIVGCAIAYYLAKQKVKVHVLEKDAIGSQASGVAAGLLYPLAEFGPGDPNLELSILGQQEHRKLAQELLEKTGVNVGFAPLSDLRLAFTEEEEAKLRELTVWHQQKKVDATWVSGDEVRRLEKRVAPHVRGAFFLRNQAQVEAYSLVVAMVQAAEQLGVVVRPGHALGVEAHGGRVTAVSTPGGRIEAEHFVFAMGPWTHVLESWLGVPVPVLPLRGQIYVLDAEGPPFTYALHHQGNYVVTKASGSLIAGTTEEKAGFDPRLTEDGKQAILKSALNMVPSLAGAKVTGGRAGLRPLSADGLPIIGKLPGWDNAYVASGHGRKGVLQSPATAIAISELVLSGKTRVPLEPFAPERFLPAKRR